MSVGSSNGAAPLPSNINLTKAKVLKKKNDWSWEDEMLMYDISQRDFAKKRRLDNKDELKMELKKLKKQREMELLTMREERKLFLGGLSPDTVEKDIRKHFTQFGQVVDAQVLRDKESGKSRAFGFVTFACSFMAEAALEAPEHMINSRKIEPRLAQPDLKKLEGSEPDYMAQLEDETKNKRSIFVAALKESITEDDLVMYFSAFGKVVRAVKSTDKSTGVKKTFGFVDFADFGIVKKVVLCSKHYIQGKRIRVELSRPRIEFSHQTKTVFVGGLEDGIDDTELKRYFSEFGFVTRALRIPNKDGPKRKFGFVDFDDYEAVDLVVSQREHFIEGHRMRVELALPMVNDSLYEKDVVAPAGETWLEKVQRKLQYAIPDHGTWGETVNNYEVFVRGGASVKTAKFKLPREMLEWTVGMSGKVVEEIANDTNTKIVVAKPPRGSKETIFSVTGKIEDVNAAQYIFQKIVKANKHRLSTVAIASS